MKRRDFITGALVAPIVASVTAYGFHRDGRTGINGLLPGDFWAIWEDGAVVSWGEIVDADHEQEGRSTAVFRAVEVLWINKPIVIA